MWDWIQHKTTNQPLCKPFSTFLCLTPTPHPQTLHPNIRLAGRHLAQPRGRHAPRLPHLRVQGENGRTIDAHLHEGHDSWALGQGAAAEQLYRLRPLSAAIRGTVLQGSGARLSHSHQTAGQLVWHNGGDAQTRRDLRSADRFNQKVQYQQTTIARHQVSDVERWVKCYWNWYRIWFFAYPSGNLREVEETFNEDGEFEEEELEEELEEDEVGCP